MNAFVFAFFLAPTFWYLWINQGSGNANFYYAITLVFTLAQSMLLIDAYYSTLKAEFLRANPQFANVELKMKQS